MQLGSILTKEQRKFLNSAESEHFSHRDLVQDAIDEAIIFSPLNRYEEEEKNGNREAAVVMNAIQKLEGAYLDYRIDGKGTPADLQRLADDLHSKLGKNQGEEAVRIVLKSVDDAIGDKLGQGPSR
jgi:hypothetical protein